MKNELTYKKDGAIHHTGQKISTDLKHKKEQLKKYIIIALVIAVGAVFYLDSRNLLSLFTSIMGEEDAESRVAYALVALFGFDILSMFAGTEIKKSSCGIRSNKIILAVAITGFLLTLGLNIYLRMNIAEDLAGADRNIVRTENVEVSEDDSAERKNKSLAVYLMFAPLITSFVSFCASMYLTKDPLLKDIENDEDRALILKEEMEDVGMRVEAYNHVRNLEERKQYDEELCKKKKKETIFKGLQAFGEARKALMKRLEGASEVNYLSEDYVNEYIKLLEARGCEEWLLEDVRNIPTAKDTDEPRSELPMYTGMSNVHRNKEGVA